NGDLASGSGDKTIKIWKKNNFELINTLNGHSNDILCLAVLKNGDLASGSQDETIRIWNTNSGILRITIYAEQVVFSLLIERENLIAGYYQADPNIYNISLIYENIKEREKNFCSSRQDGYYPNIKNDCNLN
ncbi:F-box WD repeat-containing 1A, partial [Brachionus plicatilis]